MKQFMQHTPEMVRKRNEEAEKQAQKLGATRQPQTSWCLHCGTGPGDNRVAEPDNCMVDIDDATASCAEYFKIFTDTGFLWIEDNFAIASMACSTEGSRYRS